MLSLPDPQLSRAVLIGLSEYDHLPGLPAVANNVTALHRFLTSTEGWRLPPEHCVAITEPRTPSDVIDPLRRASAEARDTLLVYYAGHGVLDERLQFYLSLSGSRADEPWTCVMEYVRGAGLLQLLNTVGWLGVAESAAMTFEVLDALEYAHEQGVIHCDMKPSKVMVTADGKVKVLGFDIAALAADPASGLHGRDGISIGTPAYLAPEAAQGAAPDVQRDLYAVGMTLYELLTGRNPFVEPGMNPIDVIVAQVENDVPLPSTANPALPSECDRILLKALAKDPDARYRSASEMAEAVLSILNLSRPES